LLTSWSAHAFVGTAVFMVGVLAGAGFAGSPTRRGRWQVEGMELALTGRPGRQAQHFDVDVLF
jgi:hypothetical protein